MHLKPESNDYLYFSEGYYVLVDAQNQKVSSERLGLKIHMFSKDSIISQDSLINTLHSLPNFTAQLKEFDPQSKGSIELDDLQNIVTHLGDDHLSHFINLLENKNEKKVFYGPFSSEIGPWFKYGRRLDQMKILDAID